MKTSTYHGSNSEDMAVVALSGVILGNVGEVCKVVSVLTRAVDVSDFVLADQLLISGQRFFNKS